MFYNAEVAVCSEICTKHINAMWAPRSIFLMLNLVVCKVTAKLWKVKVNFRHTAPAAYLYLRRGDLFNFHIY
jgi:hypothetical protein